MDFEKLFDFETSKTRQLFFLLQTAYSPCSIDNLADEVGLNRKTVLKYICKLQELFIKYRLENHLKIIKMDRRMVCLQKESDSYVMKFNACYLSHTIEVQLLNFSLESEVKTLKSIAEEINISEALLRNRIGKLNRWLGQYKLKLERKSYKLSGKESQVREFLFQFYQFLPLSCPEQEADTPELTFILEESFHSFFEITANTIQSGGIQKLVSITVERFEKGHRINFQNNWQEYITDSPLFEVFLSKMSEVDILEQEIAYLFLAIQVKFSFLFSKVKQAQVIQDHFLRKTKCFKNTQFVVERIKHFFFSEQIEYNKPVLLSYLSFHLHYELTEVIHFERVDGLLQLYELHPKFMNTLEKTVLDIQQQKKFFSKIEKQHLVYRYFHILTAVISPVNIENKKYICLLTELSPEKELALKQQLSNFFYNRININVFYGRKSKSILYADVIVASKLSPKIMEKINQPILLMDHGQLSLEELMQIEKMLK